MTIQSARDILLQKLLLHYDQREATNITHWVLEHITGLNRVDRTIHKHRELSAEETTQFNLVSSELAKGKPVQYVLGEVWFAGMRLLVNEHTLIPRPETEELIEWIKAKANPEPLHLIDIGTGSGCIPIALKKNFPLWNVSAIDLSAEALIVAQKNSQEIGTDIHFQQVDFLDESSWSQLPNVNIIVSNPPYIKQSEINEMAKHVVDHEPHLALFVPDNDALIFYKKIAAFAKTHLKKDGMIFMEINQVLGAEVCSLFESAGYTTQLRQDLQGNDRMVLAQSK